MKLWIARDKDTNELWLYRHRPILDVGMYTADFSSANSSSFEIPTEWFPEVTFENSPMEIEMKYINRSLFLER